DRQFHFEFRAARHTGDLDRPFVLVDDTFDDHQPQTAAFTFALRGEERLENPWQNVPWNPRSVVANANCHLGALLRRFHRDLPPASERLDGVMNNVRPDLIQLVDVDGHLRKRTESSVYRYTILELVMQDDQCVLDAFM